MLSQYFIDKYKFLRKQSYLARLSGHMHKYAFIGAGSHSIGNLYPCIRQLNVPLRYICTKNGRNAQKMAVSFPGCEGISDLETILENSAVKGVFVCTQPSLHPGLTRKLLSAGKSVFVEKPPAFSLEELDELIALQGERTCMVGLQRRFSTISRLLAKQKKRPGLYHYRYLTGRYPEGDPVYELFIHPVDNAVQLFGDARVVHLQKMQTGKMSAYFLHLEHEGGVKGLIELSADHSWGTVKETLEINTGSEIFSAEYPFRLSGIEKPAMLGNIPSEKLFKSPINHKIYFDNNGTIPTGENNSLVSQGFYGEIENFVRQVEENKTTHAGNLTSLRNTYEILDRVKEASQD